MNTEICPLCAGKGFNSRPCPMCDLLQGKEPEATESPILKAPLVVQIPLNVIQGMTEVLLHNPTPDDIKVLAGTLTHYAKKV